jgi:DNA mismatch repair ATPase MutL
LASKLISIRCEKDSHPVGTTVKVTVFFKHLPVRQQTALQNSTKFLTKIRKLVQAYSLAKPHVRLRFHVLKAKSGNYDLIYAPKADASVEDAVVKVISKDCASQCGSTTLEKHGFLIRALLPKSTATGTKISTHGAFISIDSRPVANNRGITKQIVKYFMDTLRRSNHSLVTVKMPFMYMNIACPPGSYDANIEPAKDDVIFDESGLLMVAVEELLDTYYTAVFTDMDTAHSPHPADRSRIGEAAPIISATEVGKSSQVEVPIRTRDLSVSEVHHSQSQWASTMYGASVEDEDFVEEGNIAIVEEEEDLRSAEVSNPWTIAKMNAPAKPRKTPLNIQRPSPTKSQSESPNERSPSVFESPLPRPLPYAPLTPQS